MGFSAPAQCGFIEGHECLDALFVFRCLIDFHETNSEGSVLWVALSGHDVLMNCCQQIDVCDLSQIMQATCPLYDRVVTRLTVK